MRIGRNLEVRPLGGAMGCGGMIQFSILASILASVILTILVNLIF